MANSKDLAWKFILRASNLPRRNLAVTSSPKCCFPYFLSVVTRDTYPLTAEILQIIVSCKCRFAARFKVLQQQQLAARPGSSMKAGRCTDAVVHQMTPDNQLCVACRVRLRKTHNNVVSGVLRFTFRRCTRSIWSSNLAPRETINSRALTGHGSRSCSRGAIRPTSRA